MAVMRGWPRFSVSIRTPWHAAVSNCSIRTSRRDASDGPVEDARPWKKTPAVIAAIERVLEHDTAGDPISGLRWSRRTTVKIAEVLTKHGWRISPNTVARLLHRLDYSLHVNRKQVATTFSPDRNQQFEYIAELRDRFQRRRWPIISVDTKKRELVGLFKNAGARWDHQPRPVYDHDFRSDARGIAIPYGIYDLLGHRGSIVVGVSHDTPPSRRMPWPTGGAARAARTMPRRASSSS
jgi:hypothetical protein